MPARYSSAHSLADAEALARALGIGYEVIPIDTVFQSYLDVLAPVLGGGPLGATEENVQARVRGAVLMAISNRRGSILLSTGNKSELAVGYCTLYGDMCGGLAVISDVPKMLSTGLRATSTAGARSFPESTLTKPPSAELRPDQKDTDSLPPYEILDPIIAAYVERHLDAAGHRRTRFRPGDRRRRRSAASTAASTSAARRRRGSRSRPRRLASGGAIPLRRNIGSDPGGLGLEARGLRRVHQQRVECFCQTSSELNCPAHPK